MNQKIKKIKKVLSITIAYLIVAMCGITPQATSVAASTQLSASPSLVAKPTNSMVMVNGKKVAFDAYSINGNNYFKLRDLAYILNGTKKQFDVVWDEIKNAITLTSGKSYTVVGGEMQGKGTGDKRPIPSNSMIYLDGKEAAFTAYSIEGNNYFKLRDIASRFNFGVDYDESTKAISINTDAVYINPVITNEISDPELARAVSLGIGTKIDSGTISFEQFFKLLDNTVKLADPSKIEKWQKTLLNARSSSVLMTRGDGIASVYYAAEVLGEKYYSFNVFPWGNLYEKMSKEKGTSFRAYNPNEKLFSGLHESSLLTWENENWNRFFAAYLYSTARRSQFSGKLVFDFDEALNSMHPDKPLTNKDALLAALRLYDSGQEQSERIPTEQDKAILAKADARRTDILNSNSSVTVTGTKYYVSNNGNDYNKGTSPETAWATLDKVNKTSLMPGDGVYFERGGIWRGTLSSKSKITFSAYGTGEKPKFYGSPENGASPEKWSLMPGTKNIWVFYKDMLECGTIVFNDGDSWANKTWAYWDGNRYMALPSFTTAFDVKKLENHYFFNDVNLKGWSDYVNGDLMMYDCDRTGPLYLRCDEGNPGKVYSSIEFSANTGRVSLVKVGKGSVVDNLCVMYNGNVGIEMEDGATLQNCEIGWVGGAVWAYRSISNSSNVPNQDNYWTYIVGAGDGIMLSSPNSKVMNNLVHDCYQSPYTIESGWDKGALGIGKDEKTYFENIHVKGNLFERNEFGGLLANYDPNDNKYVMRNILFDDNYYLYSGYGWSYIHFPPRAASALRFNWYNSELIEDVSFTNNVFYLSRGNMFDFYDRSCAATIKFSSNTYAQSIGQVIIAIEADGMSYYFNLDAQKTITDKLGDKTAIVLP